MFRTKKYSFMLLSTLFFIHAASSTGKAQTRPWVDGYFTGYGGMKASEVDYSAMSVVIDFAVEVGSSGSLNATGNGVSAIAAASVAAAHAAGDKVIVSFGGAGNGNAIASAISSNLSTLVSNIVAYVKDNNFDGCDLDMEPVGSGIATLVQALRADLPSPTYIITATSTGDGVFGKCYQYLDQINLMTYDIAGNWSGWVSWYNGSLYEYGKAATNGAEASACCDAMVNSLIKAGVPANKIGIGSEFGGAVWSGVTGPNQTPGGSVSYDVPYNTIKGYGGTYSWDPQAQASYTVSSKGWATYDDTADVAAKMRYIQSKGLGGLIIWSLDMDHKSGTVGQDPLLNALKANWGVSGPGDTLAPVIAITSPTEGSTVSGTIDFSVNIADIIGISLVVFKIDGTPVGTSLLSPFTMRFNTSSLPDGTHNLSATAYNLLGDSATASITVTTSNAVVSKDTVAPTVSITAPAKNAAVSGVVAITASATDNVGVASVQFRIDGAKLGNAVTASPYTASWTTTSFANGSHSISASATDAAGNSATTSVTVTVSNTVVVSDTTLPVLSITAPSDRATVSDTVTITADASDPAGIASVQFWVDGDSLGSPVTVPPYAVKWVTTTANNGRHRVSAVAVDSAGNRSTSYIIVSVSNIITASHGSNSGLPSSPELSQNYPNPFNPSTNIAFTTPEVGFVSLKIFNTLGEEVSVLIGGTMEPGKHAITWDASSLPSGVYICRFQFNSIVLSTKMLLMK